MIDCMWVEYHDSVKDHPKTKALAERLSIPVYAACGLLANLWAWAVDGAKEDGRIDHYREKHIEQVCRWDGEPGILIVALQSSGFLDGSYDDDSLRIHDWPEYGAKLMERRAKDAARKQRNREKEKAVRVTVTRDGHGDYSHSHSNIDNNIDTNREHVTQSESDKISSSSIMSGDARGLHAYFETVHPGKAKPNFNVFTDLLAKGFEEDAIRFMIDKASDALNPSRYFKAVCEDKANEGMFTLAELKADELKFERQKTKPNSHTNHEVIKGPFY